MIRASALYIVIIIALVIGLLCAAVIGSAYFYRAQYQKKFRYDQLAANLQSGIVILTANTDSTYQREKLFSLFGGDADSVSLQKTDWGLYEVGIAKAFIQKDTLYKAFSLANQIDSDKRAALYLIDEDRPFSLSGKTSIRGNVWIPKAGVQQAYIDNHAYSGDRRLIVGNKHNSDKQLPPLNQNRINGLDAFFKQVSGTQIILKDSLKNSFLKPSQYINFKKDPSILSQKFLSGNMVLLSDTTLIIDSTSTLNNILVFAKAIVVRGGFHGRCQLFARDSISIGKNCSFAYPSVLGIIRTGDNLIKSQEKIQIGDKSHINGIIFSYEKSANPLKPLIFLGKNSRVSGQLYSQGVLQLNDGCEIDGNVFTSRFWYRTPFTLYENYLINTTIDSKALSRYYLGSKLLPTSNKKKKVLQWLEAN